MAVDKKVLYSFGGGKVKEVSGLLIDPATGEISTGAKITVSAGGIDVTGTTLLKSGATISNADLAMTGRNITGLPSTPSGDTAATSKAYVDAQIATLGSNSHTYTGFDNTTAGLVTGSLVALKTGATGNSDRLVLASNAADTTAQVIGVVVSNPGTTSSESITVLSDGYATTQTDLGAGGINAAINEVLYLGTAGDVTKTAPTGSGSVVVIAGYVADQATDKVHFQIRGFQQN